MRKLLQVAALSASLVVSPCSLMAQDSVAMADAVTAAITRLHHGKEGTRTAIAAREKVLPMAVTLAASKRLQASVVTTPAEYDLSEVVYDIRSVKATANQVEFYILTLHHQDDRHWMLSRQVWVERVGNAWVVKRVRNGAVS
jgi:hypothetical protein